MTRKPLMAGNWKSNLNHQEAVVLVQKLAWTLQDKKHDFDKAEVVVIPPFTDIRSVQTLVDGDHLAIGYGAQDVSAHDGGAYTGEISAAMLAKLGCSYVVVGHSERRQRHDETDALGALLVRLADDGVGVLLVEHDIPMVMGTCSTINVLDFGQMIATGTAAAIQEDLQVQSAYLGGKAATP